MKFITAELDVYGANLFSQMGLLRPKGLTRLNNKEMQLIDNVEPNDEFVFGGVILRNRKRSTFWNLIEILY